MTEKDLQSELDAIGADLGKLYRRRDEVLKALADIRGEYELPKPRYQTDKQRAIARCPRCSGVLPLKDDVASKEKAAP